MYDVIGKRRWFFAFSLLITIPGLIFILLTPLTGGEAGLKFSIDYTGGTTWSIKFADASVTAEDVRAELATLDQPDATVTQTGKGFFDIRLSKLDLRAVRAHADRRPDARAQRGPDRGIEPAGSPPRRAPAPSASPAPTATPAPSGSPEPTAIPGAITQVPTEGEIGRIADWSPGGLRSHLRAGPAQLDRCGREQRPRQPGHRADPRREPGHPGLDHAPLP